jgi:hypothetical protein
LKIQVFWDVTLSLGLKVRDVSNKTAKSVNNLTGDHQYETRRNRSPTDQMTFIRQTQDPKQKQKQKKQKKTAVYQLSVDFKKAYDSVTERILCNIPPRFVVPKKLFS